MKKIAIIGMGYVGLPLALRFSEEGAGVLGIDIDEGKISALKKGESYIKHIDGVKIKSYVKEGIFEPSSNFGRVAEADAIIICVPTPLNKNREPDISYIIKTAEAIAPHLKKGTLVSLESTTYPGTTDGELRTSL
ncbi:MAG: nucleotide sugar dehydrogenase, partial [Oxalobacteraceae bacterium]|nr:nucleotide sugar dehydrogenase [Oxalobacteraceae bacterium]